MSKGETFAELTARAEIVGRNLSVLRRLSDLHSSQVAIVGTVLNLMAENREGAMEGMELSMSRVEESGRSISTMVDLATAEVEELGKKIAALRGSD